MIGERPKIDMVVEIRYKEAAPHLLRLISKCWAHNPENRPSFDVIKARLLTSAKTRENMMPEFTKSLPSSASE